MFKGRSLVLRYSSELTFAIGLAAAPMTVHAADAQVERGR